MISIEVVANSICSLATYDGVGFGTKILHRPASNCVLPSTSGRTGAILAVHRSLVHIKKSVPIEYSIVQRMQMVVEVRPLHCPASLFYVVDEESKSGGIRGISLAFREMLSLDAGK